MSLRSVSYGGGVQSTALLVLAAQRRIDFPLFLFANVGDDSEHPDTLRYVRDVAMPYAEAHGIELVELHRTTKDGSVETLYERATSSSKSFPLPMFGEGGMPLGRACTSDFKIKVIAKELRRRGATSKNPATVAMGISVDEIERARPGVDRRRPAEIVVYPLLDLGLRRSDCENVIRAAGLPVPPKSACWFCPFHGREAWRRLKRETPDLFDRAAELERTYQAKLARLGKRQQWITRYQRPLADTVDDQLVLDGMDGCDSGWCMT